jgi:hypothetical protein
MRAASRIDRYLKNVLPKKAAAISGQIFICIKIKQRNKNKTPI